MIKHLLFPILLFTHSLQGEESPSLTPLFTPPKEWHKNPTLPTASRIKTSFFTKTKKEFCPSINLTEEKVSSSIDQYIKTIQEIYESDSGNRFRRLGTLKTKAGTAYLTSLDIEASVGKVRVLQSIFLQEGTAYILTGAVLQEDFGLYQKDLIDSFRSFSLTSHLSDYVKNETQKNTLLIQISNLLSEKKNDSKYWETLKDFINQDFKEEGLYWQSLILEDVQKKLSKSQN